MQISPSTLLNNDLGLVQDIDIANDIHQIAMFEVCAMRLGT
jgi:hypothetical protein